MLGSNPMVWYRDFELAHCMLLDLKPYGKQAPLPTH